jgi:hypothetical protein
VKPKPEAKAIANASSVHRGHTEEGTVQVPVTAWREPMSYASAPSTAGQGAGLIPNERTLASAYSVRRGDAEGETVQEPAVHVGHGPMQHAQSTECAAFLAACRRHGSTGEAKRAI